MYQLSCIHLQTLLFRTWIHGPARTFHYTVLYVVTFPIAAGDICAACSGKNIITVNPLRTKRERESRGVGEIWGSRAILYFWLSRREKEHLIVRRFPGNSRSPF
jgi:hypothetical protein